MAGGRLAARMMLDGTVSPDAGMRARPTVSRTAKSPERPIETRVRDLQASAGNAAVGRFLQREVAQEAGAAGTPVGGGPKASILTFGSEGDEVSALQRQLNRLDAAKPRLALDGVFGRLTQAAVRNFQEQHPPLKVDGDAGPETRAALEKTANDPFEVGKAHYAAGRYGLAYDEFSKAYEMDKDPAILFDRAQALRLMGGRREETIALYEQFIAGVTDDAAKEVARKKLEEVRGPGTSGDEKKDDKAVDDMFQKGKDLFAAEKYAQAYDEFSKAYEVGHDPAFLWNRAQALRLLGGRRAEAIALYEQVLTTNAGDDTKAAARRDIADLRGPGKSGDAKQDETAVSELFKKGQELYAAEQYAQAYDAFSKAYEISGEIEMVFNRAQSLRFLGGRRAEAIALFEQVLSSDLPEDTKKAVHRYIEDLRGPGGTPAKAGPPAAN